jgi:uncharacterized protein YlxP (DUF503 family)
MIVAVQTWELHLPGCHSLKDKRSILQRLKQGLRRSLNVAVSETDHQDLWQRTAIACATVGSDRRVAEEVLRSADRMVAEADGVRVMETQVEFL